VLFIASLPTANAADLAVGYGPAPAAFAPSPSWYLRGDVGYASPATRSALPFPHRARASRTSAHTNFA
jgi:hypothetical protein